MSKIRFTVKIVSVQDTVHRHVARVIPLASGTTWWGESDYTIHGYTVNLFTRLHARYTSSLHDGTRRYGTSEGKLTLGQPRPRMSVSAERGNQRLGRLVVEAQVAVLAAHREG